LRRFPIPEFALGFLFATAICLVVLVGSLDQATYHQICETNQQTGKESCASHNVFYVVVWYAGYWLAASATAITALATGFIAWFTWTLRQSTEKMWGETKKAADAADTSAKAVTVVERAYIYPVIDGVGGIEPCITSALVSTQDDDDVPASETTDIQFRFKNFGKTPAILKTAFASFGVARPGALMGLSIGESVLASLEATGPFNVEMWMGITRRQAQRILAYEGHICFEGHVTFDDIWGNEHTTEFYFVWDKRIGRMRLTSVGIKTKAKQDDSQPQTQEKPAAETEAEAFWATRWLFGQDGGS
jgi:hypothetical protein